MKSKAILSCLAILFATTICAQAQDEPKYMRSSIYTVLVKSDKENAKLDNEIENPNLVMALVDGVKEVGGMFKKGKKQEDASNEAPPKTTIRSKVPQEMFPKIPIPEKFNNHNLDVRIIELDPIAAGLSKEEIESADAKFSGKQSGGKKFLKGLGKEASSVLGGDKGGSALISIDTVSQLIPASLNKYFAENHVAEQLVAKWFGYNAKKADKWDKQFSLITDRGLMNASAQDIAKVNGATALLSGQGFDLIKNTFVIAINLRYRSDKAIMAEAQQLANVAGSMLGGVGMIASQAAGAVTGYAVGNGYSVQANTYLYQLEWNDDISMDFAENIFNKNASLQDLINKGICKLKPLGKAKESAHVRQSLTNSRPESELVRIAVAQAIDKAISKLQEKVEEFRTVTPITGVGEGGIVYAKIGTKEGLSKNDEYEILEAQEDSKTGRINYKSVGTVKVVEKQIWDNRYGVADDLLTMTEEEIKNAGYDKDAIALGATSFKGAKKGQDYTGYLLRLKKKK